MSLFVSDSWRCGGQQCGEQGGGNRGREDEAGGGKCLYIFFLLYRKLIQNIHFKGEAVRARTEGEIQAPGGGQGTGKTQTKTSENGFSSLIYWEHKSIMLINILCNNIV